MVKNFTQNVEIVCKSPRKTSCKSLVKLCVKFLSASTARVKLHFPTHFSLLSHPLTHNPPTPIQTLTYPLFHSPYYYNY